MRARMISESRTFIWHPNVSRNILGFAVSVSGISVVLGLLPKLSRVAAPCGERNWASPFPGGWIRAQDPLSYRALDPPTIRCSGDSHAQVAAARLRTAGGDRRTCARCDQEAARPGYREEARRRSPRAACAGTDRAEGGGP